MKTNFNIIMLSETRFSLTFQSTFYVFPSFAQLPMAYLNIIHSIHSYEAD